MEFPRLSRFLCVSLLAASLLAGMPISAEATVLAVESFNYPSNLNTSINGLTGGSGFSAGWVDTDPDVTTGSANTSLAYPADTSLVSSGGRIALTAVDTSITANRGLTTSMSLLPNGNVFYSSALVTIGAIGQTMSVTFQDATNIRWNYGINATGNFTAGVAPDQPTQNGATSFVATAGTTYLVVSKIRTNTGPMGNDEVFLKVFAPNAQVIEPFSDAGWDVAVNSNSGVNLNRVNLNFSNPGGQALQFDELRIGTTFADVAGVPEPGKAALLFMGLACATLRRRR